MLEQPAERRTQLETEIETLGARTTAMLEAYKQSIFTTADQANYDYLLEVRENYQRIQEETVRLASSGQITAAAAQCQGRLLPALGKAG